jgi:hypothetical protein
MKIIIMKIIIMKIIIHLISHTFEVATVAISSQYLYMYDQRLHSGTNIL